MLKKPDQEASCLVNPSSGNFGSFCSKANELPFLVGTTHCSLWAALLSKDLKVQACAQRPDKEQSKCRRQRIGGGLESFPGGWLDTWDTFGFEDDRFCCRWLLLPVPQGRLSWEPLGIVLPLLCVQLALCSLRRSPPVSRIPRPVICIQELSCQVMLRAEPWQAVPSVLHLLLLFRAPVLQHTSALQACGLGSRSLPDRGDGETHVPDA